MSTSSSSQKILEGVFAINKPPILSSAQVLRDLQTHFDPSTVFSPHLARDRRLRADQLAAAARTKPGSRRNHVSRRPVSIKLGHGGTLDPLATGVLIVGVGKGTKELQRYLECTKSYECVVLFGAATDTYDTVGQVVAKMPFEHVTETAVREALGRFRGKISQRPPVYSAIKVKGKKMYEYAREGGEIPEIKSRDVEVLGVECVEWLPGGSHEYKWPSSEAPEEVRVMARKLGVVDGLEDGGHVDTSGSVPGALKRKREDEAAHTEASSNAPDNTESDTAAKKSKDNSHIPDTTPTDPALSPTLPPDTASATTNGTITETQPSTEPDPTTAALMSGALPSTTAPAPPRDSTDQHPPSPSPSAHPPAARLRMTVTSGFYVRSLCHDLGQAVGSAACMAALVRTRQAGFSLGAESAGMRTEGESSVVESSGDVEGSTAQEAKAGNVLEYADLAKGEAVWGPRVREMLLAWEDEEGARGKGRGNGGGVGDRDEEHDGVEGEGEDEQQRGTSEMGMAEDSYKRSDRRGEHATDDTTTQKPRDGDRDRDRHGNKDPNRHRERYSRHRHEDGYVRQDRRQRDGDRYRDRDRDGSKYRYRDGQRGDGEQDGSAAGKGADDAVATVRVAESAV